MQGYAAVYDVFDDEDVGALDRDIEIFGELHFAGARLAPAVAGNADEVDERVAFDGAREIGQKVAGAFEDANEKQSAFGVVGVNLRAHFADALPDLFFGQE